MTADQVINLIINFNNINDDAIVAILTHYKNIIPQIITYTTQQSKLNYGNVAPAHTLTHIRTIAKRVQASN